MTDPVATLAALLPADPSDDSADWHAPARAVVAETIQWRTADGATPASAGDSWDTQATYTQVDPQSGRAGIRPTSAGYTLDLSTEVTDVTNYGPRRDPAWTFTDAAGHAHTWESGTWHEVQDDPDEPAFAYDVDGEEYNASAHIECKTCGDHLRPGMLPPTGWHEHIPGPVTAKLTGQRSDGATVTATLTDAERQGIQLAGDSDRDSIVLGILDALPDERITLRDARQQA